VLETHEWLAVKTDSAGNLVITIPASLAGINHPVIRVSPVSYSPAVYEDGTPVEPVKPGIIQK
jgi:hypothetical protein